MPVHVSSFVLRPGLLWVASWMQPLAKQQHGRPTGHSGCSGLRLKAEHQLHMRLIVRGSRHPKDKGSAAGSSPQRGSLSGALRNRPQDMLEARTGRLRLLGGCPSMLVADLFLRLPPSNLLRCLGRPWHAPGRAAANRGARRTVARTKPLYLRLD